MHKTSFQLTVPQFVAAALGETAPTIVQLQAKANPKSLFIPLGADYIENYTVQAIVSGSMIGLQKQ